MDGTRVGLPGTIVGKEVDGTLDGEAEGAAVGCIVGNNVGRGVGEEVGTEIMVINPLPVCTPWLFCRIVQPLLAQ